MSNKRRRTDTGSGNTESSQSAADSLDSSIEPRTAARGSDSSSVLSKFDKRWKVGERSDAEILELQIATWKSDVYAHFHKPVIDGSDANGVVRYKFICKSHPSIEILRKRTDDSTGNLKRHVEGCDAKIAPSGQTITNYAHGSTYTKERMRYLCARWVVCRHRPYIIIQDPELLDIFRMLFSRVEVPHPTTLSRDVKEIHAATLKNIARMLQDYLGRLHICIDGWTSPNVFSFLGITVHFVIDGKMISFILDFVKLSKGHTGVYLSQELVGSLRKFGVEKKILAIVADNASNNNTLVSESESWGGINTVKTRVRCFAHILNLVVKAITSGFTKKASKTSEPELYDNEEADVDDADDEPGAKADDDDDEYEVDRDREDADSQDIAEIILEVQEKLFLSTAEERNGRYAVTKLVNLAKRVFNSPTIREDLKSSCEFAKIEPKQFKKAVPTRWNSLAEAIGRALDLRQAIDRLLSMAKYDKATKEGLRKFKLTRDEWVILTQLYDILKPFLRATEIISQSNTPLLHEVIPLMDILTQNLQGVVSNTELERSIRVAAARGLEVLNKYYVLTDKSVMYRAAIILHPKYKLEYFRRQNWAARDIRAAEEAVREQWLSHYKVTPRDDTDSIENTSTSTSDDIFRSLDSWGAGVNAGDALDEYLSSPVFTNVRDPLQWWNSQLVGGNALARMALDFLSAPASSVDVERAFSRGGLTVSKRRHALLEESTRCATVLGSWMKVADAVPEEKILKAFREKSKRSKKTDTPNVFADLSDGDFLEVSDSGSESD